MDVTLLQPAFKFTAMEIGCCLSLHSTRLHGKRSETVKMAIRYALRILEYLFLQI